MDTDCLSFLYCQPLLEGSMMRQEFPLVADWCQRMHDLGGTLSTFVNGSLVCLQQLPV